MAIARCNLRTVHQFVSGREVFDGSNLKGRKDFDSYGQLPYAYRSELDKSRNANDFYVVISYHTPIAWFANGIWCVPNVVYSDSTSRQQSALRLVKDGTVWKKPRTERAYAYCGA